MPGFDGTGPCGLGPMTGRRGRKAFREGCENKCPDCCQAARCSDLKEKIKAIKEHKKRLEVAIENLEKKLQ